MGSGPWGLWATHLACNGAGAEMQFLFGYHAVNGGPRIQDPPFLIAQIQILARH